MPYLDARRLLAEELEDAPFRSTIVEPVGELMEQLLAPWLAPLLEVGVIAYPLPAELPVSWHALDDLADELAGAVTEAKPGRYAICGPEPLTGEEAADALASACARPVRWETIDPVEYGEMMRDRPRVVGARSRAAGGSRARRRRLSGGSRGSAALAQGDVDLGAQRHACAGLPGLGQNDAAAALGDPFGLRFAEPAAGGLQQR